jgi:HD-GYP domain-containing protein (c-di-GMP phosphodiesterase class II)
MIKFNADFAIFGVLLIPILDPDSIGSNKIGYINKFGKALYGNMVGIQLIEAFYKLLQNREEAKKTLAVLQEKKAVTSEGRLGSRFVKIHSRYIYDDLNPYIQCAIFDLSESKILRKLLLGTSEALKRAAEAADENTGQHIVRINQYSCRLAELWGMSKSFVQDISKFAQLHDIGKIKVADLVRLPRKLTSTEFAAMKNHTIYGAKMVEGLEGLEMAFDIALEHHEKCDGSGYPRGKRRSEISLAGRIASVADVFDALVSLRPYKPAFSYDQTYEIILKGDGRVMPEHFDPELLEIFRNHFDEFVQIHQKHI